MRPKSDDLFVRGQLACEFSLFFEFTGHSIEAAISWPISSPRETGKWMHDSAAQFLHRLRQRCSGRNVLIDQIAAQNNADQRHAHRENEDGELRASAVFLSSSSVDN